MMRLLLACAVCAGLASTSRAEDAKDAKDAVKGKSIQIKGGWLYIPQRVKPHQGEYDLLVHFHGDLTLMRKQFDASGLPGFLIVVNYNGLSAAYSKPYEDPKLFGNLLHDAFWTLVREGYVEKNAGQRSLHISSFSAGYGAVRQILKEEEYFKQIDGLLLADSLYAGFTGDAAKREVDPANMKDFRRIIEAAVKGEKRFVLTHSMLHTPTYASTVETADDLLKHVKLERKAVDEKLDGGMRVIGRAGKEGFQLIACDGNDGQAHMQHLRNIGQFWAMLTAKK